MEKLSGKRELAVSIHALKKMLVQLTRNRLNSKQTFFICTVPGTVPVTYLSTVSDTIKLKTTERENL
jgi:hypothetical protein